MICIWVLTDRTTNGNHLQMSALKLARQRRLGSRLSSVLNIEDLAVGTNSTWRRDGHALSALEAVDKAGTDASLRNGRIVLGRTGR